MLNPFPALLAYGLFAPFILRVVVGLVFLNLGYLKITRERERWMIFMQAIRLRPAKEWAIGLGILEIAAGGCLIAGFGTQVAALALLALVAKEWLVEYREDVLVPRDIVFYTLLLAILISLLLSGAGLVAFDLPL